MNVVSPVAVESIPAAQETARPEPARLVDIDRAKGLAILLVVIGHLARDPTPGNAWYIAFKEGLYQFHMPFFMCLSGVTLYLSYRDVATLAEYTAYVRARFVRLMPAFFAFGLLVLIGKEIAVQFVPVDNMHGDLASGAWLILTKPITSSAGFLWYIYTLFLFCLVMPLLMRVGRANPWWLLPPALLLHCLPLDKSLADWFMFSQFAEYLLYLVAGFCVARFHATWVAFVDRHAVALLALFVALLAGFLTQAGGPLPGSKTVLGLASIPALHALVRMRWDGAGGRLARLGAYSFTIYLFNLLFIGLVKGVALKLFGADTWFPLLAPILVASGLLLPIALSRLVLQRLPWLDRMTR